MPIQEIKKHSKHAKLTKPNGGEFHRNEWGIIGAPCSLIQSLAKEIHVQLNAHLNIGFLDADHKKGRRKQPFFSTITDKINFIHVETKKPFRQKQNRHLFDENDVLLVNGNHFNSAKQIVIIHEDKKDSLSRKLDRLTDIKMVILMHDRDDIYDFVLEKIGEESAVDIFRYDQVEKISNRILLDFQEQTKPLFGLILAGGKSQRMGVDKGAIQYHSKNQREHEADILSKLCNRTFISCRKNQDELIETQYEKLYDTFEGLGPFGGILSAFREHPNTAWLTLACDLPLINDTTIQTLINGRDPRKLATCFYNPDTDFPEPLITIWEPRAYGVLLQFLSMGYSCPRKVLINSDIEMIKLDDSEALINVNDQETKLKIETKIALSKK